MANKDSSQAIPGKRVALVTGSALRLGKEITHALHAAGFDICIHYNSSLAKARDFTKYLNRERNNSAFTIRQNLKEPNAGQKLIMKFGKYRKRLDLLVNNASVFHKTSLKPTTDKDWENIIAINVRAPHYLSLSAAPLLKKTEGSIINISDIHGNRPRKDYSIYCISKAALNALTLSFAIELAPEIRVNCIAPGAITWARSETSVARATAVRATPLKRTGNPSDISDAVMYLTNSTYLTGQILNIDGGRSLNV